MVLIFPIFRKFVGRGEVSWRPVKSWHNQGYGLTSVREKSYKGRLTWLIFDTQNIKNLQINILIYSFNIFAICFILILLSLIMFGFFFFFLFVRIFVFKIFRIFLISRRKIETASPAQIYSRLTPNSVVSSLFSAEQ